MDVRLSTKVTAKEADTVKELAEAEHTTPSAIIREALREYLAHHAGEHAKAEQPADTQPHAGK